MKSLISKLLGCRETTKVERKATIYIRNNIPPSLKEILDITLILHNRPPKITTQGFYKAVGNERFLFPVDYRSLPDALKIYFTKHVITYME